MTLYKMSHLNRHDRESKAAPPLTERGNPYAANPVIVRYIDDARVVTPVGLEEEDRLKESAEAAFPGRVYRVLPSSVVRVEVTSLETGKTLAYRIEELLSRPITLRGEYADEDYRGQRWAAELVPSCPWAHWSLVQTREVLPFSYEDIGAARQMVIRMVFAACPNLGEFRIAGCDLRFARAVPVREPMPGPVRHRRQMAGRRS